MRANLGCGDDEWGDVRVDLDPDSAANVIADLQEPLNFPDQAFDDVRCISVLEHILKWRAALSEMLRVTRKRLILEVPVNSDIRITDLWRILFPTPKNLRLFITIPERARETVWQMDPEILRKFIEKRGFTCSVEMVFQIYCGVPSRCWRLTCWRKKND